MVLILLLRDCSPHRRARSNIFKSGRELTPAGIYPVEESTYLPNFKSSRDADGSHLLLLPSKSCFAPLLHVLATQLASLLLLISYNGRQVAGLQFKRWSFLLICSICCFLALYCGYLWATNLDFKSLHLHSLSQYSPSRG